MGFEQWFGQSGGIVVDLGNGRGGSLVRDHATGQIVVQIRTNSNGTPATAGRTSDSTGATGYPTWLPLAVIAGVFVLAGGGLAGAFRK
ncbi:MAG: hypothetical protein ACREUY_05085 [Burkholderiales bacterium]